MKTTKVLAVSCALLFTVGALTACGRDEIGGIKEEDKNKLVLNVSNYQGGFGRAWLDNAAARYEELHKDDEFSNGKKGVKLSVNSSINDTAGFNFVQGLGSNPNDIFFTEDAFYYDVTAGGYALDITDIVTEQLTDYGESRSVEDKMDASLVNFFKTSDKKYYALPHYETYYGIIFNVDVFDEAGLWLSDKGEYIKPNEGTKSKGPDGLAGTYDDGLPATYAEFYALCDYMPSVGVTPFALPGAIAGMPTLMLYQLFADYEGRDNYLLNYTFDGLASDLVSEYSPMKADGTFEHMMPATQITSQNGWLTKKQAGMYAALEFAQKIVENKNTWCTSTSFSPTENHLSSKDTFLKNGRANKENKVAFITDGVWWENEAEENNIFSAWESFGAPTKETGRFAVLPPPKASSAQVGQVRTIATNCNLSLSFINAKLKNDPEKAAVAKDFLQFLHSDKELTEFSVATGTLKPFNYTISAEKKAQMSYFGQQIVSVRENENIDTVYGYSNNEIFLNNFASFYPDYLWANHNPVQDMYDKNPQTATPALFYNFIAEKRGETWWKGLKGYQD